MSLRLSMLLALGAVFALPATGAASPYAAFTIHPGEQASTVNGEAAQAIITVVLSNSSTTCTDWLRGDFQQNKQYLLMRLSARPMGDALTGCYAVTKNPADAPSCTAERGTLGGVEFFGAAKEENAGAIKSSKFITGGRVSIDRFILNEDGTGTLKGFANVHLGHLATGGVIDATWCRPSDPEAALRQYQALRDAALLSVEVTRGDTPDTPRAIPYPIE